MQRGLILALTRKLSGMYHKEKVKPWVLILKARRNDGHSASMQLQLTCVFRYPDSLPTNGT